MEENRIIKAANESQTMSEAAAKLNMHPTTFRRRALKLGCYRKNQGSKGISKPSTLIIPLSEILEGGHPQYQSYKLKRRLIEEGIFEDRCSKCGWNEKAPGRKYTSCELDHIDGDRTNHRLENLRILCPNCHSLTLTYRYRRGKQIEH
jgi:5-methylcytosine-specific restriction endonuclease McrA